MNSISLAIFSSRSFRSSSDSGAARAAVTSLLSKYHSVIAYLGARAARTSWGTLAFDLNSTRRPPSGATSVSRTGFSVPSPPSVATSLTPSATSRASTSSSTDSPFLTRVSKPSTASRLLPSQSTNPAASPRRHRNTRSSPPSPSSHSGFRYSSAVKSRPFPSGLSTCRTYLASSPGYTVHIALDLDDIDASSEPRRAPSSLTSVSARFMAVGRVLHFTPEDRRSVPSNHPTWSPRTSLMVYCVESPALPPARTPGARWPCSWAPLISSRSDLVCAPVRKPSMTTKCSVSSLELISARLSSISHHHSALSSSEYLVRRKNSLSPPAASSPSSDVGCPPAEVFCLRPMARGSGSGSVPRAYLAPITAEPSRRRPPSPNARSDDH